MLCKVIIVYLLPWCNSRVITRRLFVCEVQSDSSHDTHYIIIPGVYIYPWFTKSLYIILMVYQVFIYIHGLPGVYIYPWFTRSGARICCQYSAVKSMGRMRTLARGYSGETQLSVRSFSLILSRYIMINIS